MFCNECGSKLKEGSSFCSVCGAKVIVPLAANTNVEKKESVPMETEPQTEELKSDSTQYDVNNLPPQSAPQYDMNNLPPQSAPQYDINNLSPQSALQYDINNLPPQSVPQQGIYPQSNFQNYNMPNTDKNADKENGSNKKLIVALSIISSLILVAVIAILVIFVFPKKSDDSSSNGSNSASVKKEKDKDEDGNRTTAAETDTEEAVVDTSYDGLWSNLSNLVPVTIRYVSSDVSDYPNVKLYFTVEDSDGNTVMLSSPNAAIKEVVSNGAEVEREIKSFEQLEGREGISIELVADKSGSMDSDLGTMQTIMSQFVNALDYESGDMVELIAFDSYVMYMCTYTQDTSLLNNGIYNMTTYGETALYDALYEAVTNAGSKEGARCVIAFTDGIDNCSVHTSEEVINLANTYSVPIFIIGSYGGDYTTYSDITGRTGGIYWDIDSVSDMSTILDSIYTREKNMYCLEYVSDSSVDAYAERNVSCVMSDSTYGSSINTSFTATHTLEKEKHESRYELIVDDISWSEANEACLRKGGHLITITSQEEMDIAVSLAESAELRFVWMGGYTSIRNDEAYGHWITGEPFEFQPWYPGEPSRTDEDGAAEMYLMLWQVNDEWSWNDQRNDPVGETGLAYFKGKTGYICEYED